MSKPNSSVAPASPVAESPTSAVEPVSPLKIVAKFVGWISAGIVLLQGITWCFETYGPAKDKLIARVEIADLKLPPPFSQIQSGPYLVPIALTQELEEQDSPFSGLSQKAFYEAFVNKKVGQNHASAEDLRDAARVASRQANEAIHFVRDLSAYDSPKKILSIVISNEGTANAKEVRLAINSLGAAIIERSGYPAETVVGKKPLEIGEIRTGDKVFVTAWTRDLRFFDYEDRTDDIRLTYENGAGQVRFLRPTDTGTALYFFAYNIGPYALIGVAISLLVLIPGVISSSIGRRKRVIDSTGK
ncbi:hypothetical protein TSACC_22764 [Terrimicrobium sacchariphilum]|uniref:Uncharacterized protein n=1 Tax=Terrimicrobium sacchariphilum TaxID=690879 RepID=A0A146G9J2_TERSA|nr:hypothetical protein [Terrimicrobium sacchariphilum]GAT34339.1 hypothetical protein TSACC_22764 [Terrimicrobium sacchariphilum]